jgi:hypothetical protein
MFAFIPVKKGWDDLQKETACNIAEIPARGPPEPVMTVAAMR